MEGQAKPKGSQTPWFEQAPLQMSEPTDGVPEQVQERGSADLSPAVSPLRAAVEYVQQSSEQDLDELEYRIVRTRALPATLALCLR